MKLEPEFQKQHKISQVYLKQFGFKKEGKDWVSVLKIGKGETENILISQFSTEINIFDFELPDIEPHERRQFENLSGLLEDKYRTIINTLKGQGKLIPLHKDLLNHFVANLLCRNSRFRSYIDKMINDELTKDVIIEELEMFGKVDFDLDFVMSHLTGKNKLNFIIGFLMDTLVKIFRNFSATVLKANEGYGWLTTDSPVYLDTQGELYHTIPVESEIYLPLSRDYCLFMYHKDSKINSNPLRALPVNKVCDLDFLEFDKINNMIARGFEQFLIFYTETEPQKI
ncbi:DUF4238 domain-containing protein [Flavobacterium hauense]